VASAVIYYFSFIYFGSCVNDMCVFCSFSFSRVFFYVSVGKQAHRRQLEKNYTLIVYVRPYLFLLTPIPITLPIQLFFRSCVTERVSFVPLVSLLICGSGTDPISLLILVFLFSRCGDASVS